MLNLKDRKERAFEEIKSVDDVINLLKTQFKDKKLHIKYETHLGEVKINEFLQDKSIMLVTNPDYMPEEKLTIYGLLDKYIEIGLHVEEVRGPGYFKCKIENIKRASHVRKEIRFKVTPEKVVATNFKISKHTIDISNFNIPTSIKVLLDQFHSQNSHLSDIVKVGILEDEDIIFEHIKKTGETLFVEDISNPESYKAVTPDFVDAAALLSEDLNGFIKKNIEKGYKSIIICPVIYITESETSIPFAYIQLISKSKNFQLENVLEIKDLIFRLIDRIRDANTLLVQVHQTIIDISKSGARLMIEDENLKKYMLRAKGFVFDIVFKLQAPITIYADIRSTFSDEEGNMFVGVDFAGNSSRQNEMKRYYSMLDPMIKEYKDKLLKEIKHK